MPSPMAVQTAAADGHPALSVLLCLGGFQTVALPGDGQSHGAAGHFHRIVAAHRRAGTGHDQCAARDFQVILGVDALVGVARDAQGALAVQPEVVAGIHAGVGVYLPLGLLCILHDIPTAVREQIDRPRRRVEDSLFGRAADEYGGTGRAGDRHAVQHQPNLFGIRRVYNQLPVREITADEVSAGGREGHDRTGYADAAAADGRAVAGQRDNCGYRRGVIAAGLCHGSLPGVRSRVRRYQRAVRELDVLPRTARSVFNDRQVVPPPAAGKASRRQRECQQDYACTPAPCMMSPTRLFHTPYLLCPSGCSGMRVVYTAAVTGHRAFH